MLAANSIETADHSDDVVLIAEAICDRLGINGTLAADVKAAAQLHDIGKTSIPLEIVDKPGPLTPSEWALMREHTVIGERILSSVSELEEIARLVRHSHERWDGQGYPDGLAGEEIPLGSRIVFCADAFHAIRSDRPYGQGKDNGGEEPSGGGGNGGAEPSGQGGGGGSQGSGGQSKGK